MTERVGPPPSDAETGDADLVELYAQAGRAPRSAHLDEQTWERLTCGELKSPERERAIDHIVACSLCGPIYRGVLMVHREAPAFDSDAPRVDPSGAEDGWGWAVARWTPALVRPVHGALVAALTASVALGVWAGSLYTANEHLQAGLRQEQTEARRVQAALDQRQAASEKDRDQIAALRLTLDTLAGPELNLPIVDLDPRASIRGAPGASKTIDVPTSARLVALVLSTSGQLLYPAYAVEILDGRGQVTWTGEGLRRSPFGTFTLAVPRSAVAEGQLHLRVFGIRDGRRDLVEEYAARLRFQ